MSLLSGAELIQLIFDMCVLIKGWRERKEQKGTEKSKSDIVYDAYQHDNYNGYSGYHE